MTTTTLQVYTCSFLSLLILGTIIVTNFELFHGVSKHGKLLVSGNKVDDKSLVNYFNRLQVPKRYFRHMYWTGLASTLIIVLLVKYGHYTINKDTIFIIFLFFLHLLRRLWECYYMTLYQNSSMHIMGYLVGIFHYILTPLCILTISNCNEYQHVTIIAVVKKVISITIFICGTYIQYHTHHIFYKLKESKIEIKNNTQHKNYSHSLPTGFLFNYICCPHYFGEILIYFSFCIFTTEISISMILLAVWVQSNLSVVALQNLKWYKNKFDRDPNFPKSWKSIIPFVY